MASETKRKGEVAESAILARLIQSGKTVAIPFGDNQRYDLVVDTGTGFLRVQVKLGRYRNGCVLFNTSSTHGHRNKPSKDYRGAADLFGVYCPALESCYLVPVVIMARGQGSLRVVPARNSQQNGVYYAKDFML